uniref:HTH_Tnp_Tc3_1 domain-containing protein n=1 Tax=Heterorhabditis bacteriophora TaxID=37862 RepID=A0A1I7XFJ5_HETBA
MSRAFTLSLHEKGLIKVLSTIGYTLKRIADVKSSGRPSKLNGREIKEILRTASNNTISIVGIRRTCGIDASKTTKYPELTQVHKDGRFRWARLFMTCDWKKVIFSDEKKFNLNGSDGVSFTFQQDNATIHVSRSTNTWLEDNDVGTTDWPSRSPDLNPMEDL